jgi:hypothetical protein
MDDLIVGFRGGSRPILSVVEAFSLENGSDFLERRFELVQLHRQENSLLVDDAAALIAFCLSVTRAAIPEDRRSEFAEYVERLMRENGGEMRIAKDAGMFVAA